MLMPAWADPSDQQVLDLHQRWIAALAGANNFNVLTPMMSKASIQEIASMDAKQQEGTFMMLKMAAAMGNSNKWTVESHRSEKGHLIYKLAHKEKSSRGESDFPVVEEGGQLKVDFRRK